MKKNDLKQLILEVSHDIEQEIAHKNFRTALDELKVAKKKFSNYVRKLEKENEK